MKKRLVSIISVAISCLIMFSTNTSVFASGYGDGNGVNTNAGVTEYTERGDFTRGLHRFVATETDKYIVSEGATEYKIVYTADPDEYITSAVSEFAAWFGAGTGVSIAKESDDIAVYSENAKYICLGKNAYSVAAEVGIPENLKTNGYVIKTVGNSVILVGGSNLGTLFGTYALLNHLVGLEFFGTETYSIDSNVRNLKLCNYDVIDNPDVNANIAAFGAIYYNSVGAHRLGYQVQYGDTWMCEQRFCHNSLYYLSPDKYYSEHSVWFTGTDFNNDNLCYTAHGDEEEFELMVDAMVEELKPYIREYPDRTAITITQQDNTGWCGCPGCQALISRYGSKSATQMRFMNRVGEEIEAWLAVEAPGRENEVKIGMFAYHATMQPPTKNVDEIKLRENTFIFIAPYGATEFTLPYEAEANSGAREIFEGWKRASNYIAVWPYQTFYDNYLVPYNNWGAIQDQWKMYADCNAFLVFNQGQQNNGAENGFSALKIYLNGKYGRNVNLDQGELIDRFFENYYGKKDGYMRKFYEELNLYMRYLRDTGVHGKSLYQSAVGASLFPFKLLEKWADYCNKAIEEIEPLKTQDKAKYDTFVRNITKESMMPRYFICKYHIGYYNKTEQTAIRRQFAQDCLDIGLNRENEGSTINGLIEPWL